MAYTRKKTPEILNKIIQFIWHYQHLHHGVTPPSGLIAREVGCKNVRHYTKLLEEQGRLDVTNIRPFTAHIPTTQPDNKRAIDKLRWQLKKEAEKAEKAESVEALPEPPEPPKTAMAQAFEDANYADLVGPPFQEIEDMDDAGQPVAPASDDVLVVDASADELRQVAEKLAAQQKWGPVYKSIIAPTQPQNWAEAEIIIRNLGGDLDAIARPYIMATAKVGDLLEALLDRGYTVHKTNPRWRD